VFFLRPRVLRLRPTLDRTSMVPGAGPCSFSRTESTSCDDRTPNPNRNSTTQVRASRAARCGGERVSCRRNCSRVSPRGHETVSSQPGLQLATLQCSS
jgi:hypothetical protein